MFQINHNIIKGYDKGKTENEVYLCELLCKDLQVVEEYLSILDTEI
jgi:hypothetical protein